MKTRNDRSLLGLGALTLGGLGLAIGITGSLIAAGLIPAGVAGSYALAVKIVDAIIAGSSVAAIVGLLLGGGLGAGVIATLRWAIAVWGRKRAIA